jgi:acyl-CoA thioesterase-2
MSDAATRAPPWDWKSLPHLVAVDPVEPDRFRNRCNQKNAYFSLFGGQIVAQALGAATATVSGRTVHSLHGYFLRAGSVDPYVDFRVERVRDGGRFSTRRVTAVQNGQVLFTMDCSFKVELEGFDHQQSLEFPFDPEGAIDIAALARTGRPDLLPFIRQFAETHPIEIRIPEEAGFLVPGKSPRRRYWLRAPSTASVDDSDIHLQVFSYLSDFFLSGAPLVPHTVPLPGPHIFVASLDHTIWFHRPVRCDDWLLFDTYSPSAHGGVNLTHGLVYDRGGALVATLAQEALQIKVTEVRAT